jgi:hypothetical protein
MIDSIERMVRAECEASGSPRPPEFECFDQYPLTDNDPEVTENEPTLSNGTQALVVAALTYLTK